MIADAAISGALLAVMHFSPIPVTVALLIVGMNSMAGGGWRHVTAGIACAAMGAAVGAAVFGVKIMPSSLPATICWLVLLGVYQMTLAKVAFDTTVKLAERSSRLRMLSERDSLTGLVNRDTLVSHLRRLLREAESTDNLVSVLFIDLDSFKLVNDSLGHRTGDQLLVSVSQRILDCLQEGEVVGRYGGDEFIVVKVGPIGAVESGVAQRLLEAIAKPLRIAEHELFIEASIGVSMFPADAHDDETLIRYADAAMYVAKEEGRNCYRAYRPQMGEAVLARRAMSMRLRSALADAALTLQYQPQFDMRSGKMLGVEALVRWYDELYGNVSPEAFIPIAEGCGLIDVLGEWVLRTACKQAVFWQQQGFASLRMCVNLSPLQLQREQVVDVVDSILAETSMDPKMLELEVTEGALARDPELARHLLDQFRTRGIAVAVDDFGIGYSNLGQLRSLGVDRIKIDRTFVEEIGDDRTGAIVKAIISLAQGLGVAVIAEGVESTFHRDFLLAAGCSEAQGFLFSRPLNAEGVTELLRETDGAYSDASATSHDPRFA